MGLDFGASHQMSLDSSSFTYVSPSPSISVMTADDTLIPLAGVDFVITPHLSLPNVYLVPKLRLNLASVGQLCNSDDYCIHDLQSQKLIGTDRRENKLYILDELKVSVVIVATTNVDLSSFRLSPSSSSFYLWHSCLCHILSSHLRYLASIETLGNLQSCDILMYGCKLTKFSALPFNQSIYVSSSPFDLIHSDVRGHSPVAIK